MSHSVCKIVFDLVQIRGCYFKIFGGAHFYLDSLYTLSTLFIKTSKQGTYLSDSTFGEDEVGSHLEKGKVIWAWRWYRWS